MKNRFILITVAICWNVATAFAQSGPLDPTFDMDGVVTTIIGGSTLRCYDIAIQSDGKIVAAGETYNNSGDYIAVMRYNNDGSLDTTFDTDGIVITDIGNWIDIGFAVAIQSDDKIVVGGVSYVGSAYDIAVLRYNSDGSLDTTFDADGIVTTPIGNESDVCNSIAIQTDGKIVVAGESYINSTDYITVMRYNSDGSLDTTFNTDGIVTTLVGSSAAAKSVAIQTDGKIVVGGVSHVGSTWDIAVVRYNSDGSLDNTFHTDGIVTTPGATGNSRARSVAIQTDGKIVVGGDVAFDSLRDFMVVRYNSNGSRDHTFDTDGIVTTDVAGREDRASSLAIQTDGKIVMTGWVDVGSFSAIGLVQYNSDGSLDTGFDSDGKVTTAIGSSDSRPRSVEVQSDGKILVAGYSDYYVSMVRYDRLLAGIKDDPISEWGEIFPNPFSIQTTLQMDIPLVNATLTLTNSLGLTVKEIKNVHGQTITLQRDNLPSGLYFVRLTEGNHVIATKKIIITD